MSRNSCGAEHCRGSFSGGVIVGQSLQGVVYVFGTCSDFGMRKGMRTQKKYKSTGCGFTYVKCDDIYGGGGLGVVEYGVVGW